MDGQLLGTNLTLTASGGQANAPAAVVLGVMELPTPIPLPGSPGCNIYQDMPLVFSTTLNASGTGSIAIPVPNNKFYRAQIFYSAWAALNGSQVDTSNTRRSILHGVYDVARIYNLSNNASPTGSVQASVGLVVRLHY